MSIASAKDVRRMKLVVALALAAAMPSAQAIGKSKACDDPVHCFALDVFGDTCQSVREEATTPNGADVALYPLPVYH